MSITGIILAVVAVGGVGLFVGVFLGIAALKFKVEVDEKEEAVLAALPGNNCGGCGFPGCSGLAAAIAKGVEAAKKNLIKVPVLKGTVPHEQAARFGGAEVLILPASEGTGVVAGGAMRAVLESVGIKDVLAKSKGSSNPHNLVKATILALSEMRDAYTVAQQRGVSMEKVFRG